MNIFQNMLYEFDTTGQTGSTVGKPWHLSFVKPFVWTQPEQMEFHKESVCVSDKTTDYRVNIEYAVLTIERPWFHTNLFCIPFRHRDFDKGQISDGTGKGFLPAVNTGIIVTKKIAIDGYYENNRYQIVGWIVKNIPICP